MSSSHSIEVGKVYKKSKQKHGIKLAENKMEPVLLGQTRVPAGMGKSQNKGKGMGRTSVETWKGKCQLGSTQCSVNSPDRSKLMLEQTAFLVCAFLHVNSTTEPQPVLCCLE